MCPQTSLEGDEVSSEEQTEGNWGTCGVRDAMSVHGSFLSNFTASNRAQALISHMPRGCCWSPNSPLPSHSPSSHIIILLQTLHHHGASLGSDLSWVRYLSHLITTRQPRIWGSFIQKHSVETGDLTSALAFAALKLCGSGQVVKLLLPSFSLCIK